MKHQMTTVFVLIAAVIGTSVRAQDNEAEKLFRDMEKKITSAQALQVVFTYQLGGKTTHGSLFLTKDKQARLQVRGPFYFGVKNDAAMEVVSDGKQFKTKGAKFAHSPNGQLSVVEEDQAEIATPNTFHAVLSAGLSRVGIWSVVITMPTMVGETDPNSPDARMMVRDFEAGAAEKVGEHQAKVIRYRVGKGGNDDPIVTLWIDSHTGLPCKREVSGLPEKENFRITEHYSEIKLDPPVNAKTFELPR